MLIYIFIIESFTLIARICLLKLFAMLFITFPDSIACVTILYFFYLRKIYSGLIILALPISMSIYCLFFLKLLLIYQWTQLYFRSYLALKIDLLKMRIWMILLLTLLIYVYYYKIKLIKNKKENWTKNMLLISIAFFSNDLIDWKLLLGIA